MKRNLVLILVILVFLSMIVAACSPVNHVSNRTEPTSLGQRDGVQNESWNRQIDAVDQSLQDLEKSLNSVDTLKDVEGFR